MSYEPARVDVVTAVEAALTAWPTLPKPVVAYDNRKAVIDPDKQSLPYLCVETHYIGGGQISLGRTKVVEALGQIHLVAHAKQNAGSAQAQLLLDHFQAFFELKNFSLIRTHAAMPADYFDRAGWRCWPVVVPFWFHRLVT
jgi:hypothetical protein